MPEFIRYIRRGMRKAIVVGVPDFSQNNQYLDMENLNEDFQYSRKIILESYERTKSKKTRTTIKRK